MRLAIITATLSYILTNWFYDFGNWLWHWLFINIIEIFKFIFQILCTAALQYYMNKHYLKFQDRKKNEKVFENFTKQEEMNKKLEHENHLLFDKTALLDNKISAQDGKLEIITELLKNLNHQNNHEHTK